MHEAEYRTWWDLHLRASRGETLSAEEQAAYDSGLQRLQREEQIEGDLAPLRAAKVALARVEAERARLQARHEALASEIAALESALSERTKELLRVRD
jgi:ABC-type phosphate transport system auxiliary subunit